MHARFPHLFPCRITRLLPLLCLFALCWPAQAQDCAPGKAEAYLDVGNVRARLLNNGALFWRGSPHVYNVPKGGSANAIFSTSIVLGGIVQDTLRLAGSTYGPYEFFPGPILPDAALPDTTYCKAHDRLYEITQDDFVVYARTGEPTPNLHDWPAHLGAPVIDGDGIPDNYNLAAGDRPAMLGDQMLWWVMNDLAGPHARTDGLPMGMEVHVSAFAFGVSGVVGLSTFYRYRLVYKGTAPLEDAYFGLYADTDLGSFDDDYVGSDTTLHLGYTYNADAFDEGSTGYGEAPPALGYAFLPDANPEAEGATLGAFVHHYGGGGPQGDPHLAADFYQYLQARWLDGQPVTLGGDGRDFSTTPTRYMYSGDPVTRSYWTELNLKGTGWAAPPSDRSFLMSTGPFTMQPGEEREVAFAILWSRGADHLDSVRKLREDTAFIQERAPLLYTPREVSLPPPAAQQPPELAAAQNHPNPFTDRTVIRYSLPQTMQVRLTVYDVLGREVARLVEREQEAGSYEAPFDASGLPAGLYLYRLQLDHHTATRTMLRVP